MKLRKVVFTEITKKKSSTKLDITKYFDELCIFVVDYPRKDSVTCSGIYADL
jgi:hypothetical protein